MRRYAFDTVVHTVSCVVAAFEEANFLCFGARLLLEIEN